MIRLVSLIFLLLIPLLPSQGYSGPRQQPVAEQNDAEKKEQYEKSMEERFRRLGKNLDELEARAAVMAEQARKKTERALNDAEKKRDHAGKKLEEMKADGRKRWSKFSKEMSAALDEFEQAYERAKKHFQE